MHKLICIFTLSLFIAGGAFSQSTHSAKPHFNRSGVNLSLWKGVATQRTDSLTLTYLNLGLISSVNQLHGIGVNAIVSLVQRDVNGCQLSGVGHCTLGSVRGVSVAGLVGLTGNKIQGLSVAGLTHLAGASNQGVSVGGLLNINGDFASGLHIGGLANITNDVFQGVSVAGLLNIVGQSMQGVQLSGLLNIATESQGVQLSPMNVAVKGKGVQIGLINYYREKWDGFQLGLVNANAQTQVQLMAYGGNFSKINLGVRFKNDLFYTILGVGSPYLNLDDKFSASAFYRAGLELPLTKKMFISGDLGFQHIELFKNHHHGYPRRLYGLEARMNLEYRLNDLLGVFITTGYGGSRYYSRNATYDKGMIVEGGCVLYHF